MIIFETKKVLRVKFCLIVRVLNINKFKDILYLGKSNYTILNKKLHAE